MVDEVVTEGQQNEKELHSHGRVPRHLQNIDRIPRVFNCGICCVFVERRPQEARKENAFHCDEEQLDANQMAVEEWLVLASDRLLELNQDEDLINVEAAEGHLHSHQWEVNIVALV